MRFARNWLPGSYDKEFEKQQWRFVFGGETKSTPVQMWSIWPRPSVAD